LRKAGALAKLPAVTGTQEAAMRLLMFFAMMSAAVPGVSTAAQAQNSLYYMERGHWTVVGSGAVCRAYNRPLADLNAAPYNALVIAVRSMSDISIDVYFWPGAIDPAKTYRINLDFAGGAALALEGQPEVSDIMLSSAAEPKLWRQLQDASSLRVTVGGEPLLDVTFTLDGARWVADALTSCTEYLPKG
jgi:hypothetical protein